MKVLGRALLEVLFCTIYIFNELDKRVPLLGLAECIKSDSPFIDPSLRGEVDRVADNISAVIWNWYLGYRKANAPNSDGSVVALDEDSIKRFVNFSRILIEILCQVFLS